MKTLKYSVDLEKRNQVGIEPGWSTQIDRWYQLDELGFSFCEALHEWNYLEAYPKPDMIFLAIEGASNVADYDFVNSSSQSPAKFVYTLPNISAAVIFQMLKLNGKVYCLSAGADTLKVSLQEAESFAKIGKKVWIFSSPAQTDHNLSSREIIFNCL